MTTQQPQEPQQSRQPQLAEVPGYVWSAVADAPSREIFPGIRLRPLWRGDDGANAQVLEMDPHSSWEGIDVHEPGPEEVFVVSGVFNDGHRDYPAGTFLHAPAGSSHVPQTTTGCTLFVFYPQG
ncbi:cupin domain-containing protein [Streptomyces sp. NRRL S-920]|uniref:cupin domain-containing protein n=1 Tax=Streptomyces sp. NRRL S-920 TaxID=1463921 RepID=UPI00068D82AC|nr:cupin domain-containing protein [Streptomyces sp. NRRL S-920]